MNRPASRDADLDFAKGLACLFMVMGHTAFFMGYQNARAPGFIPLWIAVESPLVLFFMATGMNVIHYVRHNTDKKGWGPTKNYLLANAALFVCGLSYNLNRQSLGLMDLFQGIACAAFFSYIPFRRRWPSWAIVIIALETFIIAANYAVGEGFAFRNDRIIENGYLLISTPEFIKSAVLNPDKPLLMSKYLFFLDELAAFPRWKKLFFIHFSVFPWTGCTLLGGVLMRHARRKSRWLLWGFFIACLALSVYALPFFTARHIADYYFRGKPDYILRHVGIAGIILLFLRRYYASRGAALKWVEFIGRQSMIVFIGQWIIIEIAVKFIHPDPNVWSLLGMTALTLFLLHGLTKYLAGKVRAGMNTPGYAKKWFRRMIVLSILTMLFHYGFKDSPAYANITVAHLLSYGAAISFALAFPALRQLIRKPKQ